MTGACNPLESYETVSFENIPIYIHPEKPDWFIPTRRADFILRLLMDGTSVSDAALQYCRTFGGDMCHSTAVIEHLLSRIDGTNFTEYRGRGHYRELRDLKECWFHITNRCNMACTHCMFSSDNRHQPSIDHEILLHCIDDAFDLGCKVFYFTGGEPFVYKNFTTTCNRVLDKEDTHVVILSNGKNLEKFDQWFRRIQKERVHLQISIDGGQKNHDALRGAGAYQSLMKTLEFLSARECFVTLAMSVNQRNVHEMASVLDVAKQFHVKNIHYLWFFKKGRADSDLFVPPPRIYDELIKAYEKVHDLGIAIDNFEILKSQVFSIAGTRFDLSNSAWESLAIGPDGTIYPSPALIGEENLAAGHISEGLENVWRHSPILDRIRKASLVDDTQKSHLLRYVTGGGDIDHSYIASRMLVGHDPYMELYERMILYLLSREAESYDQNSRVGLLCRMGERVYECDEDSAFVGFTHSNCVLSLPGKDGYSSIRSFYTSAAETVNEDIINPVVYSEDEINHIPVHSRIRSYGCGSPVLDCELCEGETLVDLGSGAGVECFIAARKVGSSGRIYGIDMADEMLRIARKSAEEVAENLGYCNVAFRKGFLEKISVDSGTVDVVISNCVINLSPDKRQTFREIIRILRPGGRICISDIVCDEDIPVNMKYNEKLRGECIGGAMKQTELVGMLEDLNFEGIYIFKRFLYRQVKGYNFYSITYTAYKPHQPSSRSLLYRGPFAAIMTDDGTFLHRGATTSISMPGCMEVGDSFFELDAMGNVTNIEQEINCTVFTHPSPEAGEGVPVMTEKHPTGCLVCGNDIVYLTESKTKTCFYCNRELLTNTVCQNGHFVCDLCHSHDTIQIIREICLKSSCSDVIELFKKIRSHPSVPMHGPEYHSLVPAAILAVYRNSGGDISDKDILDAIERGTTIAGGSCAFLGICGAATGVGIAYSIILKANPYMARERQIVQTVTREILEKISRYKAPRCCQRDCWIGLMTAADLSERYLPITIPADETLVCEQHEKNKECIRKLCPLWDRSLYTE
jgi:MoaA/NifB/PqqE/SkfB family radical SAM enzyme/ubiquinone/menaquinone biosynthesis C-methylase UbiE